LEHIEEGGGLLERLGWKEAKNGRRREVTVEVWAWEGLNDGKAKEEITR
jgi:hypothetical protein